MKQAEVKVVVQKMVKAGESVSTIENFIKEAAKRNSLGKKNNSTKSATVESPLAQRISDLPSENTLSDIPENINFSDLTPNVSLQDMQEFNTTDVKVIKEEKKKKEEKEKVKREKFNKQIKIEDEVEEGVITKKEGEIKINDLSSIYDKAVNYNDVHNNTKVVNIKNSDESDVVKDQQLSSLIASNEVIRLDGLSGSGYTYINKQGERVPVPYSALDGTGVPSGQWKGIQEAEKEDEATFTTADMNKDNVVDRQEKKVFDYRTTYRIEAKADWETLIEVSEEPNMLDPFVIQPAVPGYSSMSGDAGYNSGGYNMPISEEDLYSPVDTYDDNVTVKEIKDEKNQAELEKILTGYYVQKYATENNMTFEDASKVYNPGEEGLIDFANLSNGSIPIEDVNKIKKYWVDNTTDRNTRETVQAELDSFYQENTSYFEGSGRYYKGRSEEQMDDLEKSQKNLAGVREETKAVTTKIDLCNAVFEKNKKPYDLLLKEIESTPTGTVIVNGEIYKDENGEEIKLPNSVEIQRLIDENKKLQSGDYETQDEVDAINKKINLNQEKINGYISSYQNNIKALNGYQNTLKDVGAVINELFKEEGALARTADDYAAILQVQNATYGGFYRWSESTWIDGFGFLIAGADELALTANEAYLRNTGGDTDRARGFMPEHVRTTLDAIRDESAGRRNLEFSYHKGEVGVAQHTMELIGGMAPMLIATALSGGTAGLLVAGVSATGGDLERTRKLQKSGEYSFTPLERYTSAILHGTLEVATERLLVGQVTRVSKLMTKTPGFGSGVSGYLTGLLNIGVRTGVDAVQEGIGEGVNAFGGNLTDRYVLGMDVSLMDGVSPALVDGMLVSGSISSPVIFKHTTNHLIPNKLEKTLSKNADRMFEINKMLENPDLSQDVKLDLEAELVSLVDKNVELQDKHLRGTVSYSKQDKQELIDITVEKHNLEKKARNIRKDKSLTKEQKQVEIKKAEDAYNELNKKKEEIINQDTRTDEEKQEAYDKYVVEVRKKAEAYNKRNPDKQIEVEELTTEEIEAKINLEKQQNNVYYQAEIDGAQNQLDNNIDKQEYLFNKKGELTETKNPNYGKELTPERRAQLENIVERGTELINKDLQQSKSDASQFGFVDENLNIFINKETSLAKGGRITTAAHEFLHAVLFKTIGRDSGIQNRLGNALNQFIAKKKGTVGMSEFAARMEPYTLRNQKGEIVGVEQNYGEEMITIMSESIMDGTLKFDEGFFTQVGDVLRRFLQKTFPNKFGKIKFNTGRDVYNFIKDYNDSIEKGYTNKAIDNVMDKGAEGRLVSGPKTSGAGVSYSKANNLQKMYEKYEGNVTRLVSEGLSQDADGNTVDNLQQSELGDGMGAIIESTTKRLYDGIPVSERNEITRKDFKEALIAEASGMIQTEFDPTRQGLDKFISTRLNLRANNLAERLGVRQQFVENIDDKKGLTSEDVADTQVEDANTKKLEDKLVSVDPELQPVLDNIRNKVLEQIQADPSLYKGKNYKSLKNIVATEIQQMFGIVPKVGNLTKTDTRNAQMFINKHVDALISMLPEGHTASSQSTGVQQVLLKEFYNKRSVRSKTGPGLQVQIKQSIDPTKFLNLFGVTERGKPNTYKKESNTSSRIKAIVDQTGRVVTNQITREHLENTNQPADLIVRLGDGKSKYMFSKGKSLQKVMETNPEKGVAIIDALFGTSVENVNSYNGNMIALTNTQLRPLLEDGIIKEKDIKNIGKDMQDMFDLIAPSYVDLATPLELFVIDKYFSDSLEGRVGYASMLSDMTGEKFVKVKGNKRAQEQTRVGIKTVSDALDAKHGRGFAAKYWGPMVSAPSKLQDGQFIPDPKNPLGPLIKNPSWNPRKEDGKLQDNRQGFSTGVVDAAFLTNGTVVGGGLYKGDKLARGLRPLLTTGATITKKDGEDALIDLSDKLDELDNEQADDIVDYLNLAIEYMQDGYAAQATKALKKFNKACKDAIGKKIEKAKVVQDFGKHGAYPDGYSSYMDGSLETVPTAKQRTAFIKQQTENNAAYRKVSDMMRELYQDKLITGNQAVSILANMNASQRGLTRASAILDFIPAESKNYKGDKLVLEHMTPALAINLLSLRHILTDNTTAVEARENLNDALDNYRLAYLPKSYDNIVNKFYKSTMPFYWNPTSTSLLRYYNAEMGGAFDLQMTQLSTGIVVGPELATSKKLMDQVIKGQLDAVSEVLKVKVTEKQLGGYYFSKASKIAKDALMKSNTVNPEKGISIWDFDDTLAESKSNVLYTRPDGTTGKLTAEEFAKQGADLLAKGYVYDFSEFSQVVEGKPGPLFQDFVDRINKFGVEDNFILTARPENSAPAIQAFLKEFGLEIPIENITGLANSTPESKALWIAEKVADGYNNIYFADDALANVQVVKNVLDQFDIKSDVVQAKIQFSKQMNPEFNNILDKNTAPELDLNRILEQSTGVKAEAEFSQAQAKIRGSKKGKFAFFVPPSAEDFKGLIYRFLAKGRIGEQQMAFFKKALFDPFAKGYTSLNKSKQALNVGYRTLLKNFPSLKSELNEKVGETGFTVDQAIRVYLWNKNGMDVPGLSKRDLKTLVNFVEGDTSTKSFADSLEQLVDQEQGYTTPNDYWLVESLDSDIQSINNEVSRQEHLAEFAQNRGIMFGEWQGTKLVGPNMNKIEAIYGFNFRDALEDILYRMEFGSKREGGKNRLVNMFNNWANQSVGAIMFFNMRSALLQTISSINYINWSDNNPLKAAAAFANQKQFWSDFSMIFNSDMLKLRRAGNQRGINEAELAQAVAGSKNKAKAALNWLLTKGFLPTQIADSFAIASGGATFYRNRVSSLMKQGLTQQEAETRAMQDFQELTEEGQQSSRPDMISQQQASPLGRYILAFKNTPMQYARLIKKSVVDLTKGRGDAKTHISKIIYYGVVQNLIFNGLQAALGAMIGDEDEEKEAKAKTRVINGMIDSLLSGLGFGGNIVMTVKNSIMEYLKQKDKGWNADHTYTILKIIGLSPTIGSKLRKIYSGIQTEKYNEEVIKEMSYFDFDNPVYEAIANVISGVTNLPLDRLVKKVNNVDAAITEEISTLERLALILGWNTWDLGIEDQDVIAVENEIKENKQIKKVEERKVKKEIKKKEKIEENKKVIESNINKQEEEKKEGKKDIKCAAVNKSGKRCGTNIEPGKSYCTIHEKAEQGTKEVQCKKIKKDKKRCGMMTKAKSGLCYYHD